MNTLYKIGKGHLNFKKFKVYINVQLKIISLDCKIFSNFKDCFENFNFLCRCKSEYKTKILSGSHLQVFLSYFLVQA